MKMSQNFTSYSDNDSAELKLDPAIQSFIAPNVKGSVEVDFDGYGTLHVLERDDEGALLSDSYLAKKEDEVTVNKKEYTNTDKLEHLMKSNARLSVALKIQKIGVVLFLVFLVLFCLLLYATLKRYT